MPVPKRDAARPSPPLHQLSHRPASSVPICAVDVTQNSARRPPDPTWHKRGAVVTRRAGAERRRPGSGLDGRRGGAPRSGTVGALARRPCQAATPRISRGPQSRAAGALRDRRGASLGTVALLRATTRRRSQVDWQARLRKQAYPQQMQAPYSGPTARLVVCAQGKHARGVDGGAGADRYLHPRGQH